MSKTVWLVGGGRGERGGEKGDGGEDGRILVLSQNRQIFAATWLLSRISFQRYVRAKMYECIMKVQRFVLTLTALEYLNRGIVPNISNRCTSP